jgi:hypothetical protein
MKCWLCNGEGDYIDPYEIVSIIKCNLCKGSGKMKFWNWLIYKIIKK